MQHSRVEAVTLQLRSADGHDLIALSGTAGVTPSWLPISRKQQHSPGLSQGSEGCHLWVAFKPARMHNAVRRDAGTIKYAHFNGCSHVPGKVVFGAEISR